MKRYFALLGFISVFFLAVYGIAEAFNVPVITDPSPHMRTGGVIAALIGVLLLVADVILPVASSIVMVAHGALFGIYIGAVLSLAGRAGAFLLGYYLGKKSTKLLRRFITEQEMTAANRLLTKWGVVGIIATRPIPILSETMSIAAGASALPLKTSLLAAVVGSLPEALLFALTGALAGSFINTSIIFLAVVLLSVVFWAASARRKNQA